MKQFKVKASYISICEVVIEANDYDEAVAKANQLDGADFEPIQGDDWNIDSVQEIK